MRFYNLNFCFACFLNRCNGGDPMKGFFFVLAKGVALASDYPYANKDQICKTYKPLKPIPNACYYVYATEEMMKMMMVKIQGPLVIAMRKTVQFITSSVA